MADSISLNWGTVRAWHIESGAAKEAAEKYFSIGKHSVSAMGQHDTPEQKAALCAWIDAVDCDTIYLDWDGEHISKDEAKKYILEYRT